MTVPSASPMRDDDVPKRYGVMQFTFAVVGPLLGSPLLFLGAWVLADTSEKAELWRSADGIIAMTVAIGFFIPGLFLGAVLRNAHRLRGKITLSGAILRSAAVHAIWFALWWLPSRDVVVIVKASAVCLSAVMVATAVCWFLTKDILQPSSVAV
jgi:hypothetical protein